MHALGRAIVRATLAMPAAVVDWRSGPAAIARQETGVSETEGLEPARQANGRFGPGDPAGTVDCGESAVRSGETDRRSKPGAGAALRDLGRRRASARSPAPEPWRP